MDRALKFESNTVQFLNIIILWRGIFALFAIGGAIAPWIGFFPDMLLWRGILVSVILGIAAVISLVALCDVQKRNHRGRILSLTLDYLGFVVSLVAFLHIGGAFTGVDALAETFGSAFPFLLICLAGYLTGVVSDYFQQNLLMGQRIRQIGRWLVIAGSVLFFLRAGGIQGIIYLLTQIAVPMGILSILGLIIFSSALWLMGRESSALALHSKAHHEAMLSGWLFLSPNLLGFLIFFAGPLLLSLYFSFTDSDAFNPPNWVGLENYAKILNVTFGTLSAPDQLAREVIDIKVYDEVGRVTFGNTGILFGAADKLFWLALRNTLTFTLLAVPLSVIPALFLANLLNSKIPGMKVFRAIYFLPSIAAIVGISLVWQWLYNATIGYINYFITLGVEFWNNIFNATVVDPKITWVSDERTALLAIVIIAAWQTMGFNTVLFLAGLQNIPSELYEAATVDGANAWHQFSRITIPLLAPSTFYVLTVTTIQAMQVFEQVFILMNPPEGPNNSTITLVLYLYRSGFQNFKQGYASAIAWVLFIVIFGLTLFQFQRQRKTSIYEN